MAEVIYNAFIKTDRSLKIMYASPFAKESYRTSFRWGMDFQLSFIFHLQ